MAFSTYLGGSSADFGGGIAVDGAGSAYSRAIRIPPISQPPLGRPRRLSQEFRRLCDEAGRDRIRPGLFDLPGRQRLIPAPASPWTTRAARTYGQVASTDFPTTAGAAQTTPAGCSDAFVAKIATLPTSTDQCKNGGWKTFGVFKNQGDCVSFVATKGKNPPSRR